MTQTRRRTGRVALAPMLVAGFTVVLAGCDLEVLNPGSIVDENLNTPELMPVVVNGVSSEFNDVQDALSYNIARLTDDLSGTGSYFDTGRYRRGIFDNEDSEGTWEQMHEAVWAAGEAWARLQEVLAGGESSSPDAAKLFALMGHAHRLLGENFCDVVYDVGGMQPREAAFDSAIVAFNQAITIGTAAGSSADHWVTAARAGLAQAYVGLGQWGDAVAASAQVPTDYAHQAIYNLQANTNIVRNETHGRAEMGVWASPAQSYGDPGGMNDPRTQFTICGNWTDPNDIPGGGVTSTDICTAHQGADGLTAHYRQEKFDDEGSDISVATGLEMRLIEAEDHLRNGDLDLFIASINEVRAFYELTGLAEPATAGALEFPNALDVENGGNPADDDGWSILDRERYMTLWLEGRRMWDLHRWDHPFLAGGTLIGPGQNPRVSCMRVPENECQLNPNIVDAPQCQG